MVMELSEYEWFGTLPILESSWELKNSKLICEKGLLFGVQLIDTGKKNAQLIIMDGERKVYDSTSSHPGVWPAPILCSNGIYAMLMGETRGASYIVEYLPLG